MSQLLDQASSPSSKSEIALFSVPSTQVAVERGFWYDVHPVNTLTNDGPYEFHVSPDPHYLDLNKNYIHMQLKISKRDGTDLQGGANPDLVGPIHLIGKTFFKQVKLFLNNKLAYDSGDTYAYRAHLETLFNFDQGVKNTFLAAAGYKADEPANHLDDDQNEGWASRVTWFTQSAVVEFMAPLHVDLFHQEKYILNNMDVRLELHRNSESFALMSFEANPTYVLHVVNMKWVVRKVDLLGSISLALESTLLRTTAKYPIRRVQIKTVQLAAGRRDTPTNTVFNGQIPRRLVIGCVDNDAFHGNWQKTPFNFKNFGASSVQVTAGGVNYPRTPLLWTIETTITFDRSYSCTKLWVWRVRIKRVGWIYTILPTGILCTRSTCLPIPATAVIGNW